MQLYWGDYSHDDAECTIVESIEVLETDTGVAFGIRVMWDVEGLKTGTDTADIVSKMTTLQNAYLQWGKDLVLYDANGNVVKQLRSLGSMTGVKIVTPPAWPIQGGAELTTFCSYRFRAQAEYLVGSNFFPSGSPGGGVPLYRSFRETLTFGGGGPIKAVVNVTNGPPQIQVIYAQTAFTASQSGEAIGVNGWPAVPPPLWPAYLVGPGTNSRGSPVSRGAFLTDYPTSWAYEFASPSPLVGKPKLPPLGTGG